MSQAVVPAIPLVLAGALLTGGCATQPLTDTASPYFRVPPGATVTLAQPVEIPAGRTRVFFQHGALVQGYDHYAPTCNLEVRRILATQAQTVAAGQYTVDTVQDTLEQVVDAQPLQLAMADGLLALGDTDNGQPNVYRGYHLWLNGPDPNLMRLSCRGPFSEPSLAYPPSIDQIREALGQSVTLELPVAKSS